MSDEVIEVPFGENASETATLLLAAAEDLGLDQGVVATREGSFVVPTEVHDKAFGKNEPKKTAAKKTTTRKK
jgi:hypothetical protein